jgi:hypothetical protein
MARTIRARMRRLKRDYPQPSARHWDGATEQYCIGGALCLAQGRRVRWPGLLTFAWALTAENRHLVAEVAWDFATRVMTHNAQGDFAAAWLGLEAALRWRPLRHTAPGRSGNK